MKAEIWKQINGYEGLYEVSNFGRIKSRPISGHRNKEIIMSPTNHCTGYLVIGLTKEGQQKVYRLHRIIAEHFCEKPNGCDVVNHLNGIKTDNRASNLEWTTVSGNTQHSFRLGLQKPMKGEGHVSSILTENQVVEIKSKYKAGGCTHKELANLYGISRTAISLIVSGKRWKHIF